VLSLTAPSRWSRTRSTTSRSTAKGGRSPTFRAGA